MTAVALAMAGCCPPPEPQYAECGCGGPPAAAQTIAARTPAPAVPHHAPAPPSTRAIPAPVMSRFQQPSGGTPRAPMKREMLTEPPVALPGPKLEETPRRESLAEPKPPAPTDTLPDEVIMKLLEHGRTAFVRCFKKAINEDPTELSFKVKVHIVLDSNGAITSATTDATNQKLDACLTRMTAWIKFPASGKPIAVELPLFYRGE